MAYERGRGHIGTVLTGVLQAGLDAFGRFLRCDNGVNSEIYEVAPVRHPLIEQASVLGCHAADSSAQNFIDPARQIRPSLRSHAASIAETATDRRGTLVLEMRPHLREEFTLD
jgi:hypothetical protein